MLHWQGSTSNCARHFERPSPGLLCFGFRILNLSLGTGYVVCNNHQTVQALALETVLIVHEPGPLLMDTCFLHAEQSRSIG